jgi:hypothetical protein
VKKIIALLAAVVMFIPSYAGADDSVRRGDSGPVVTEVQTILASFKYTVTIDGKFGPETERAVVAWQKSNGLLADAIVGPVTLQSLRSARRIGNATQVTPTLPPPPPTGLNGLPFAPAGLSDCDDIRFYREQAGLPDVFDALAYRESRCRNEDSVRTFCCYGAWQNYISSHLSRQSAYRERIINECQVRGADDINSDNPLEKQKSACVTAVVYSISGLRPWAL